MNVPYKPILVGTGILAGLHFIRTVGRAPAADRTAEHLAEQLAWVSTATQAGPVVAAALHGSAVLLAAVLLPWVVVRMLR
jgi:putative intracellular protease/amidase